MHRDSLVPVLVSSAVSVCATLACVSLLLKSRNEPVDSGPKQPKPAAQNFDQEIINEQLARNRAFLGETGVACIRKTKIVVVGAGGVGSWVATMLVRNGIGRLRVIDFDQVTLSSLNRHCCATLEDVGTSKVNCLAAYLNKVCPWVEIEPINALWTKDKTNLLDGADYVVDCIDNIDTKVDLLAYCYHNQIPVISSMGAGCKGDPTRVEVADISRTAEDPLSRATRIKLRKRGVKQGIPVVFSSEKPGKDKAKLLDLEESQLEEGNVHELSVLQDFRVRILPVLGPLPALFGLTIATHLLTLLGGYDSVYDPLLGGYSVAGKNRTKLYESCLHSVVGQMARMKWTEERETSVSIDDVAYLIEEVWKGKTITGQYNRLHLTVWDPAKPRDIHNMVPVNKEQQAAHEEKVFRQKLPLEEVYSAEVLDLVMRRQKLDQWYETFRSN
ncbi:tRNA threonylcarbamoyladenosine dehydratase 2 [Wickerhamiella sorbophila]|uniref:tRNA threonylcarbamoyladenosine dehydratase 2 n=1 Tax=Wickerhamiella sorbophila TaxID=45607 RepID=A0A2T0FNZ3_9ASCO|nr:tRNA threonylcarbamoyladenosine dehydratase 2 [Wickerhamiella sorbophila]PRT56698.1 tRNA threonylcarbamoyladenosine dehydratase 2 [Wickerhamiella sorbophila]